MQQPIERARRLRGRLTDAERLLWRYLRLRQLDGHKFRRQRAIGQFMVDFACLERKLIVEVDGGQHGAEQASYDRDRTKRLRSRGYRVLRFWNNDVLRDVGSVVEVIRQSLKEPPTVKGVDVQRLCQSSCSGKSNRLLCQDVEMTGFHLSPVLTMLLNVVSNFLIHAVRASFFGLPASSNR